MEKRTYFTKKQLISFGNYLLSNERTESFKVISMDNLEERLSRVNHSDVENWKEVSKNIQDETSREERLELVIMRLQNIADTLIQQ